LLRPQDEIKFVLADRRDYDWARDFVRGRGLTSGRIVLFSPVHSRLAAADLARWILEDGLSVRLQLQLHKFIWPGVERGV
jgi:7-carboxy-7-deazaguanine synthase